MDCRYTKQELYNLISRIRSDLLLESECDKYPIPLLSICRQIDGLALETVPFQTESLRGLAMIAENEDQNDVILLNSHLEPPELNFYCAHELIHICLHREKSGRQFNCHDKLMPNQNPVLEWQANEGGAELLIPYFSLLPKIKEAYPFMKSWSDIRDFRKDLSIFYGVSDIVIKLRLESLKYEIYQYINECALDKIKILSRRQLFQRQINIKSLIDLEQELYQKSISADIDNPLSLEINIPKTNMQHKAYQESEPDLFFNFL